MIVMFIIFLPIILLLLQMLQPTVLIRAMYIQSIYEQYRALPYALRVYVTNYDKMSDLLAQMHKISAEDNLDWFDETDIPSNSGSNIGTATGDTSKIALFTVIAAVAAAVLVLAAIRLKRSKKDHDMGEDA